MKPFLLALCALLSGFGSNDMNGLHLCAHELVSEVGGSHADSAAAISDVLVALRDKPADMVATMLIIGTIETGLTTGRRGAAGEVGLFQVMPATAAEAAARCKITGKWSNTQVNAKIAYCYYESLYLQSGFDVTAAVAAYNYGPKAIAKAQRYEELPKVTANYLVKFNRLKERTTCGKY